MRVARADGLCDTTRTAVVERLVCESPALAWDDRRLNALYALATQLEPSGLRELKASEVAWLSGSRDKCATAACLARAYAQRNEELAAIVNGLAEPMPKISRWEEDPARCGDRCFRAFRVNFARQPDGMAIGVWEGSVTGTFVVGGLLDGSFDGNILAVRVLGGRGPSWQVGVALLARRGTHLFIASMYERSSIGEEHDVEFFDGITLRKAAGSGPLELDFGSPTAGELASAWADTIDAARDRDECKSHAELDVCMRRKRP